MIKLRSGFHRPTLVHRDRSKYTREFFRKETEEMIREALTEPKCNVCGLITGDCENLDGLLYCPAHKVVIEELIDDLKNIVNEWKRKTNK